jgi:hypothetical protein
MTSAADYGNEREASQSCLPGTGSSAGLWRFTTCMLVVFISLFFTSGSAFAQDLSSRSDNSDSDPRKPLRITYEIPREAAVSLGYSTIRAPASSSGEKSKPERRASTMSCGTAWINGATSSQQDSIWSKARITIH